MAETDAGNPRMIDPLPALGWGAAALGLGKVAGLVVVGLAAGRLFGMAVDVVGMTGAMVAIGTVFSGLVIKFWKDWLAANEKTEHSERVRLAAELERIAGERDAWKSEAARVQNLLYRRAEGTLIDRPEVGAPGEVPTHEPPTSMPEGR